MNTHPGKRVYERHCFSADIAFSYFNKAHFHNAQTLNIGLGGMCFRSDSFLKPGAAIWVYLKRIHSNGSCEGLHSVTLADVKWCSELPGLNALTYGVGVKYFLPAY